MRRLWAVLLLAACAQEPDTPVQQGDVPGLLRNPTAPLASQTDATAARLAGTWYLRQSSSTGFQPGLKIDVTPTAAGGLQIQSFVGFCGEPNGGCVVDDQTLTLKADGPGRWFVTDSTDAFPREPLWALWLDFDDRTAVIGGPTGKFVWIMDRSVTGGGDRLIAARDILDWYGYDVSKLVEVSQ